MDNKYVFQNPNAASRLVEKEAVVITPEDSRLHVLNPIGARIWELSRDKISVKEIVEKIYNEYEQNLEVIQRDVREFIDDLVRNKLLILSDKTIETKEDS